MNFFYIFFSCESPALGLGWRLGFLGLLHMEVFNQRLEQEYGAEVIVTVPSVPYKSNYSSSRMFNFHRLIDVMIFSPYIWREKYKEIWQGDHS